MFIAVAISPNPGSPCGLTDWRNLKSVLRLFESLVKANAQPRFKKLHGTCNSFNKKIRKALR